MPRVALILAALALPTLLACVAEQDTPDSGAADFAAYCSGCHGVGGKGDGELAADLAKRPADLTKLTRRNKEKFPTTKVMAQIWGYAGAKGRGVMPDFGPLLEGDMVPYDGGDGIETPTPIRLVQLAQYLMAIQAK